MEFVTGRDGEYNLCHFWSNFELGDLRFFRSKVRATPECSTVAGGLPAVRTAVLQRCLRRGDPVQARVLQRFVAHGCLQHGRGHVRLSNQHRRATLMLRQLQ